MAAEDHATTTDLPGGRDRTLLSGSPLTRRDVLPRSGPREMLQRYRRRALAGDVLAAVAAGVLAVLIRFGASGASAYALLPFLLPLLWVALLAGQRAYEPRFLGAGTDEFRRIGDAGLLLFVSIAVGSYAVDGDFSRGIVLIGVPTTIAGSLLARRLIRIRLHRSRAAGDGVNRVVVVGRADAAASLIESLDSHPEHGLKPVGACVPSIDVEDRSPAVNITDEVLGSVERCAADVVAVVSHPDLSGTALRRLSWALEERGVELVVSPGIVEVAGPRLSIRPVAGLSLLHLEAPPARGGRFVLKTAQDVVLGALLLVLFAPLLLAIAIAVRATSPGPALYRQTRVGADGKEFTIFKFRTMVVDADRRLVELTGRSDGNGVLFKMKRDPRVTPVGAQLRRFSLDELPQLINVVRGEMSLVGPRPPLPHEVAIYDDDAIRRLRVKPGMTGLWQVSGRSDLTWEESLRLDLRYVDNWSMALDLTILWRTVRAVTRGSGAY